MEEAVKQGAVIEKEITEIFINDEDTMSMLHVYQLEGHRGSAFHGVFITTSRTEAAVTAERNKFQLTAVRTAMHGTAKRWIATVNHFFDIFHLSIPGMKSIFNFFIIVRKNLLQDIHKTIMHEKGTKRNPTLLD